MRTNILKSIFFIVIVVLSACSSDMRMPEVTKVSFPLVTLDSTSSNIIQGGVLNAKFEVDMYYKDYPVDSRIIVALNGDYTNTKVFVASITTFPAVETITAEQLKALFGITTFKPGDTFEVGLDVKMQDGAWYPAFNPNGVAYGSGSMNLPGASPIISFGVPLPIDVFTGKYLVDEPEEEWTYDVNFSRINATQIKIDQYWASWPATFTLDLTANTYSMAKQDFTSVYSGVESGTIDKTTGTMVGNYTIWKNGAVIEAGVHTYTKY